MPTGTAHVSHSGQTCLMSDSLLDREAYRLVLTEKLHVELGAVCGFSPVAVWEAMRSKPRVLVLVADRPSAAIREAIEIVSRLRKDLFILVVSGLSDEPILRDWGRCGIHGYMLKDGGYQELRTAIAAAGAGDPYYSAGVRQIISKGSGGKDGVRLLSRREAELLPLLARGMTLRDAAGELGIAYKTADAYRTSLLRKLRLKDRVELARWAIREGIVEA
ncbi:response regulator transcription factor [uncultured Ilyobacter sp.]|uniref:response regulator transcription factor n=1 Tax=uncultured Ilyobacter sp. TaxID=544433 RepID=UPI0029F47694|nr:response regulator transcription factor [uncultured Ilyobacter sp.]